MIFIDSNIPMYLVGADHPHKREVIPILEELVGKGEVLVTDVEVIQEILHRYTALRKKEFVQIAVDALYGIIDQVYDVTEEDVLKAKDTVLAYETLSARDAIHVAVMKRMGIQNILTFDQGFDQISNLNRVPATK